MNEIQNAKYDITFFSSIFAFTFMVLFKVFKNPLFKMLYLAFWDAVSFKINIDKLFKVAFFCFRAFFHFLCLSLTNFFSKSFKRFYMLLLFFCAAVVLFCIGLFLEHASFPYLVNSNSWRIYFFSRNSRFWQSFWIIVETYIN